MIGVTVLEKGTTNGTITDFDGNYSLSLSNPNAVLQFSYVGYKSIELVANKPMLNLSLSEDTEVLEEVVVTALGIKRSEKLCLITYSKSMRMILPEIKMLTLSTL